MMIVSFINYRDMGKVVSLSKIERMVDTLESAMIRERGNNIHQEGKNEAWTKMTAKEILFDLYYHVGKLQEGILNRDKKKMLEHVGDIGNYLGFLVLNEELDKLYE
jgi:hypothetical protein